MSMSQSILDQIRSRQNKDAAPSMAKAPAHTHNDVSEYLTPKEPDHQEQMKQNIRNMLDRDEIFVSSITWENMAGAQVTTIELVGNIIPEKEQSPEDNFERAMDVIE